ncbi:MAG: AAA family ATPase [Clostridia bacterium]|nr:AAA family ATPase [Clostridia bacterium]
MKKVIIIGCPGSGKSTFGRKLKRITDLPLYHLDMMYWNQDKTTVSKEIFIERLEKTMNNSQWIIDGNYGSSMEMRLKECDTVFFLDYPTEVCIEGIETRKGNPRSDMPWITNDGTDEDFITFVKNYNSESRPEVIKLLEKYSSKNIIVFHSREESEIYLLALQYFLSLT